MKGKVTASERRGIIVVAALALLITGSGWLASTCRRHADEVSPPEIEVLVNGENPDGDVSDAGGKNRSERMRKDSAGSRQKSRKTYRRRSPRDEGV